MPPKCVCVCVCMYVAMHEGVCMYGKEACTSSVCVCVCVCVCKHGVMCAKEASVHVDMHACVCIHAKEA
jgi:hypothetical protein